MGGENIIDVKFEQISSPKESGRAIIARLDAIHRKEMRIVYWATVAPILFTAGLWLYAITNG